MQRDAMYYSILFYSIGHQPEHIYIPPKSSIVPTPIFFFFFPTKETNPLPLDKEEEMTVSWYSPSVSTI